MCMVLKHIILIFAKMQNSQSKFHYFSFQSSKFSFVHFTPQNFKTPQFSSPLSFYPLLPLRSPTQCCFGNILFLIIEKKNPKIKKKT